MDDIDEFNDAISELKSSESQTCLLNTEITDQKVDVNADHKMSIKVRQKYGLSNSLSEGPGDLSKSGISVSNKPLSHSKSYEELFRHVDDHMTNFPDHPSNQNQSNSIIYSHKPSRFHAKEVATLVSLLQILIRKIIDDLVLNGLTMESEHVALDPLCRIVELCLYHGAIKNDSWINGSRKRNGLWNLIEKIPFYSKSTASHSAVENVKQFSSLKTGAARVRAWILLALMNKCLGSDLGLLIDCEGPAFSEIWEDWALMRSDQNSTFVCLLSSLESIDFNLYIKEQNIPKQDFHISWSSFFAKDGVNFSALQPPLELPPFLLVQEIQKQDSNASEKKKLLEMGPEALIARIEGLEEENRRLKRSIINQISQKSFFEEECGKLGKRLTRLQAQLDAVVEVNQAMTLREESLTSTIAAHEATNQSLQLQLAQMQCYSSIGEPAPSLNGIISRQTSKTTSQNDVVVDSYAHLIKSAMEEGARSSSSNEDNLKLEIKRLKEELAMAKALKDEYKRKLEDKNKD